MSVSRYLEFTPLVGEEVFIAEGARVIGRAVLGDHVNIWYNTVVRADVNFIRIGKNTNIQDLCMLHVTEHNELVIGENTSFGHSVTVHGCTIGSGCLIGMGTIILDGAVVGDNCLVAAGSLITPGKKFPAGSFIKGRPAVAERPLTEEEIHRVSHHYEAYIGYKNQYLSMEHGPEKKKGLVPDLKDFIGRINQHNLFLLSSSMSYYAVLGLVPMLLILLGVASLAGTDIQEQVLNQVGFIAPEVNKTLEIVFKNLSSRVDLGSLSGILGLGMLIFTASLIFMQLRYSLDIIHGDFNAEKEMSLFDLIKERFSMMLVVLLMCMMFAASLLIRPIFEFVIAGEMADGVIGIIIQLVVNFIILFSLFTGIYFFTPSKRKKIKDCAKMSVLTSGAFLIGEILIGLYMRNIATDSLYGAAGALFIFLVWAYYSSFTVFISVEIFMYLKRIGKVR